MATITLQLGQCGNQLGADIFAALHSEAEAASPSHSEAVRQIFFRPGRRGGGRSSAEAKAGPVARAVLVDTEPRVVQRCIQGDEASRPWRYAETRGLFCQSGAGNNWACGYNIHGPALQEKFLELLQREVEPCDRLGGFLALHSVAGGTGSGLGSFALKSVRDAFPSAGLASISVWPFETGEVSVQCYNASLTLAAIYEHADLAVVCENERYLDLCRLSLGQAHPSLSSLNVAIAESLVRVCMPCKSVRAQHGPGCPLLQLAGQLCAHPLYRLTTVRSLPQTRRGAEAFTSDSWLALQRRLLHLSETGALVDRPSQATQSPKEGLARCRTLSASVFFWGHAATEASLDPLRKLPIWQQSLDPLQVHADPHQVGRLERSLGSISNCQAVVPALSSTARRAAGMLRASAYLHQYERYGLSREDMSEAILHMLQVTSDYEEVD